MADTSINDEDLREELERYGETVLKINEKTRPIYIKKLNHLRAREAMAIKANDKQRKKSPGRQSVRNSSSFLPSRQEPKQDDFDVEDNGHSYTDERHLRRRTINITLPRVSTVSNGDNEGRGRHIKTPPRSPSRNHQPSLFATSTPIAEVSRPANFRHQEIDSSLPNPLIRHRLTHGDSNAGRTPPRSSTIFNRIFGGDEKHDNAHVPTLKIQKERSITEFSDSEGEYVPDMSTKAINTSFPFDKDDYDRSPPRSVSKHTSSFSGAPRHPTGRISFEPFRPEATKSWSNIISKIVLLGAALFFGLIASAYFYKAVLMPSPTAYVGPTMLCIDLDNNETCLNAKEREALDDLIILLASRRGEIACGTVRQESPDGFVAITEILNHLHSAYDDVGNSENFEVNTNNLLLLIQARPDWDISISCRKAGQNGISTDCNTTSVKHIVSLRSERQILPLSCRVKRAAQHVYINIILVAVGILGLGGAVKFGVWLKRRRDRELREINLMANNIIDLLRNRASQCSKDPKALPYAPVSHIRDSLIPRLERASKAHVWNQAVRHLAESETRIVQDVQEVEGEDTVVWKWNELTGVDLFGTKSPATTSTGQLATPALKNPSTPEMKRLNYLPFDPKLMSSCLKVYNVLTGHSNYISSEVRDVILDKCGQYHGILHVGCDHKIEEGVVFVKCVSEAAANQNYKALHGWTYEGRLVSVKYVSPLVYKMVFEGSDDAMVPLKSSTHRRRTHTFDGYGFNS